MGLTGFLRDFHMPSLSKWNFVYVPYLFCLTIYYLKQLDFFLFAILHVKNIEFVNNFSVFFSGFFNFFFLFLLFAIQFLLLLYLLLYWIHIEINSWFIRIVLFFGLCCVCFLVIIVVSVVVVIFWFCIKIFCISTKERNWN